MCVGTRHSHTPVSLALKGLHDLSLWVPQLWESQAHFEGHLSLPELWGWTCHFYLAGVLQEGKWRRGWGVAVQPQVVMK